MSKATVLQVIRDVAFFSYSVLIFLYYVTNIFELRVAASVIGFVFFIYFLFHVTRGEFAAYLIPFIFIVGSLSNVVFNDGYIPGFIIFEFFAHLGMVLFILRNNLNYKLATLVFYGVSIYFIVLMIIGVHPQDALSAGSRNFVSVILIFLLIQLYISYQQNNTDIKLLPALIVFVVSTWAVGRSGIASSILLFSFVFFFKYKDLIYQIFFSRFKYIDILKTAILFSLACLVMIVTVSGYLDMPFELSFSRFHEMNALSDGRVYILNKYINDLGLKELFLGFDKDYVFYEGFLAHNSYLNAHRLTGFSFFIVFFIALLALVKSYYMRSFYGLLLLVVMFRGVFDTVMFVSGAFNYIFLYLVVFLINGKANIHNKHYPQSRMYIDNSKV